MGIGAVVVIHWEYEPFKPLDRYRSEDTRRKHPRFGKFSKRRNTNWPEMGADPLGDDNWLLLSHPKVAKLLTRFY